METTSNLNKCIFRSVGVSDHEKKAKRCTLLSFWEVCEKMAPMAKLLLSVSSMKGRSWLGLD